MLPRNAELSSVKRWRHQGLFLFYIKSKGTPFEILEGKYSYQENANSCLLARLKHRAEEVFIAASTQTAKPLANLGVYLGLSSIKEIYEIDQPFPYPYLI